MRILVCGDIHCKPYILESALKATKWDLFVFLGDACDNFGATQEDNINIVKLLIETKKKYGDKFVWLLGNHDWGYYDDSIDMTGHIRAGAANVHHLLKDNIDLWDLFYAKDKYIFSHAGISADFLIETSDYPYKELKEKVGANNPMNNVGYLCGGSSPNPSLLWARPEEVKPLALDNIQIVGHTPVSKITVWNDKMVICDTFSQYPDKKFYGDKTLLLIDGNELKAINYETGRKKYGIDLSNASTPRD